MPTHDVIVYSQNETGLIAAFAAQDRGLNVALIRGHDAFGGMLTNGLLGADGITGLTGVAMEYFVRCGAKYGQSRPTASGAPSMNTLVLDEMCAAYPITIYDGDLASMTFSGGRVTRVTTTLGAQLDLTSQGVCLDGSFGGDMLVMAGAKTRYGREAQSVREPMAGFGVAFSGHTKSPYRADGSLMYGVKPWPADMKIGGSDDSIQGWNFRSPIQKIADGGVPFTAPPGYDPAQYEWYNTRQSPTFNPPLTKTYAEAMGNPAGPQLYDWNLDDIPYPALDPVAWIVGTPAQRATITAQAGNWQKGWFYFFANDPSVQSDRRAWWSTLGLPSGEFTDNGNWPHQMYLRTTRRLEARYMLDQYDVQNTTRFDDMIAGGLLSLDQHVHQIYASAPGARADGVIYEGKMGSIKNEAETPDRFPIPYRAMIPADGAINVASSGYVIGATAVAQGATRATGSTMQVAQAMGLAAHISVTTGKRLHRIGEDVAEAIAAVA